MILTPLFILLWILAHYVFEVERANVQVQRFPRNQVWAAAVKVDCGNYGPPIERSISLDSADELLADRMTIAGSLPFLAPSLVRADEGGMGFSVLEEYDLQVVRPRPLVGAQKLHGAHTMTCTMRNRDWEYPPLFLLTCEVMLGVWCPLGVM